uniref:(northern house mosquito) hypothetical protein n=1 Tax=Culex pipiens TaxID=7175 RepID=A0A8D8ALF2_CULPI
MSMVGSFGIFGLLDDAAISFELLRFGVEILDSNKDLREFGMVAESFPGGDSFRLSQPSCTGSPSAKCPARCTGLDRRSEPSSVTETWRPGTADASGQLAT